MNIILRQLPFLLLATIVAGDQTPPADGPEPITTCDPATTPPPPPPSRWEQFKAWFKRAQRRVNDLLLVPLIVYVFLSFPSWLAKNTDGPIVNFPASYLNTPVFGILLVMVAFGFAWNFLYFQFPDEYRTVNTFRDVHREILKRLNTCTDPVQTARMEFEILDLWKRLRYSLSLLLFFFVSALVGSIAALIVA